MALATGVLIRIVQCFTFLKSIINIIGIKMYMLLFMIPQYDNYHYILLFFTRDDIADHIGTKSATGKKHSHTLGCQLTLPDNLGDSRFWTKSPSLKISVLNLPDKCAIGNHTNFLMFKPKYLPDRSLNLQILDPKRIERFLF